MRPLVLQEPFRALFYAPFYAMLARGLPRARGLAVTLVPAESLDRATAALLEGRADAGWGGPMRLLLARAADPASPLRCFGAAVVRDPFLLVGRGARPDFRLDALPTLRLGTVSEVATPWWCLQDDLRRAGLDPASVPRDTTGTMPGNLAAVLDGSLDLAQLPEPLASQAEPATTVWHAAATRGPCAYTAFSTTTARIAADPASLLALRDALGDSLRWMAASPPEAIADAIAGFFPDHSPARLARGIARYAALDIWPRAEPVFPPGALARLQAAMISAGVLPDGDPAVEGILWG